MENADTSISKEQVISIMQKYKDTMTASDISREYGINRSRICRLAQLAGIELLKSPGGRPRKDRYGRKTKFDPDMCKNRPESCFYCTNAECFCGESSNDKEMQYINTGMKG